jgi:outer membrane protein assembly factor BamB
MVKLTGAAGAINAQPVYFGQKLPTAIGGTVLVGDYLYGANSAVLECIEFKTGKVMWTNRSVGAGSVCYADGRLYLHGEDGEVALAEASPKSYQEHGHFTPANAPDRGQAKAWAYPVVANGRLYIRDTDSIWCYDIQSPGGK